ncbi:MAG: DUF1294 domain-containing protein [Ruminococcus sp.]|nr:DUF1294 domain-containing protein [Ruminococcus sp.]
MKWLIIYLLIINAVSWSAMGIDKRRAKKQKWRIAEKTLFLFVLLGGGIGGTAGMYMFHHKTKHWYFALGFPLITIIEYVAAIALYIYMLK